MIHSKKEVEQLISFYEQLIDSGIREYDKDLLQNLIRIADDMGLNTEKLKKSLNNMG